MMRYYILFVLSLLMVNTTFAQNNSYVKAPKIVYRNVLPIEVKEKWQHLDIEKDTIAGTSLDRAYKELIKNKKGKTVIVAIIDTDIDINHEDLKDAIWINKKEIPNNGIDDDKNGYIDDINGWNFLGNKKGENIVYANTESTRIISLLKSKYKNFPNFNGNKKDSLLYINANDIYKENKNFTETLLKYNYDDILAFKINEKAIQSKYNVIKFSVKEIDSVLKSIKSDLELTKKLKSYKRIIRLGENYNTLKNDSVKLVSKLNTTFNENYFDRKITGDNELDLNDSKYGNNNISKNAKWTYHGTIVSGILGANRNNNIGIKGFSDNIKIMPILAIPSGGSENDKDVALAIYYAVDNGAKIINMSFGKTLSAHSEWIKDAFIYAQKHDVLLVAGAGNDSSNNDIKPFYPIDYDESTGVEFCNNFIKVGAITMDGNSDYFLAPFTNYGKKTIDLFAPGYFLKTTYVEEKYAFRDGTSMSSPIVCGVAALVRSFYPKLTASQVKQIILDSGVSFDIDVQVPGEKIGTLNPFSEMSKSGKVVNAYNALLMAKEMSKR